MANTTTKAWPYERHSSLDYESDASFGYYVFCKATGLWSQLRARSDGSEFMLCCRERTPSEIRLRKWGEIDARLLELENQALDSVPPPPIDAARNGFQRNELTLSEVRIEGDGSFSLFFDSPTGDAINLWPVVTFDDWSIRESIWVP